MPSAEHRDGQRAHGLKRERPAERAVWGSARVSEGSRYRGPVALAQSGHRRVPAGSARHQNWDGAPPKATPLMSSFSAFLNFSIVLRFDHLRLSSFNAWILPHFAALADDLNVKTLLSAAGCDTRRSDQLAVIVSAVDAGVHPIPWLSVSTNECRATRHQEGAPHFQSFRHCTSLTVFIPVLRLNHLQRPSFGK